MRLWYLAIFALVASIVWGGEHGRPDRWWRHVQSLAGDGMEGRLAGSTGHRHAAEYIAAELAKAGVGPAGVDGYLQPVKLFSRRLMEQFSSLAVLREGAIPTPLVIGQDAIVDLQVDPAPQANAPLVFIGYGLAAPEANYDDRASLDLHGKIAVMLSGGPSSVPAAMRAHYQSVDEMHTTLRQKAGVFGIVTIPNPNRMEIPWSRVAANRNIWAMGSGDRVFEQDDALELSVVLNPERAPALFEGSGHTFQELVELADAGKPLPRFPLKASLRSQIAIERNDVVSQNVVGILPGADPKLKDEYVALTAHLDHLGEGRPGALDNASGVASLLDLAGALHDSAVKPKRSLLFLFTTAGEDRLLGSQYYLQYPTVALQSIVADVSVERLLPLFPLRAIGVAGWNESDLAARIRAAAQRQRVKAMDDPDAPRNSFTRGDQYRFALKGVPSVALTTGYEPGSPEERAVRAWLHDRDRSAADDAAQPVDQSAAARFDDALLEVVTAIANDPQRPRWNGSSFFKKFGR